MKKTWLLTILLGLSGLIILDSCRKSDDFFPESDRLIDSLSLDGSVAVPLVDTELNMLNFVPEGDSALWMEVAEDDLVHLRMFFDNVLSLKMSDIYSDIPYPAGQGVIIPADSTKLETDTSKMKVYSKMLAGQLYFDDPRVKFIFENEIPVVTFYRLDTITMLNAENEAISHTENEKYTIAAPTEAGTMVRDSVMIDKSRIPNLPEVFSPIPKYISFYTTLGSEEDQALPFETTGEETVTLDVDIDLPLEVRLDELVMGDTLPFMDLDSDEFSEIQALTLKMEFANGFPFDAVSQVFITDTTDTGEVGYFIDSLFTDTSLPHISDEGWIFESAETDASGFVTVSQTSFVSVYIDQARLQNLKDRNASKIIIRSRLNSYNSSTEQDVRILSTYKLGVKIAAKADFEVTAE